MIKIHINMRRGLIFLLSLIYISGLVGQNKKAPWVSLFNGENLEGWKIVGSNGVVKVDNGAITCNQTLNTPEHTFVCTKDKFNDFILEMDIKTDSNYNSGIILRAQDKPLNCDTCTVSLYGYQVKLDRQLKRKWTGGIFDDYGKTWHWLYPLEGDDRARNAHKVGDWNHFRMEVIGSSIKVWVNGIPTTNMVNDKYKAGYIAIKIHSLASIPGYDKMHGLYKNIRIITKNPRKYNIPMDIPAKEVY